FNLLSSGAENSVGPWRIKNISVVGADPPGNASRVLGKKIPDRREERIELPTWVEFVSVSAQACFPPETNPFRIKLDVLLQEKSRHGARIFANCQPMQELFCVVCWRVPINRTVYFLRRIVRLLQLFPGYKVVEVRFRIYWKACPLLVSAQFPDSA